MGSSCAPARHPAARMPRLQRPRATMPFAYGHRAHGHVRRCVAGGQPETMANKQDTEIREVVSEDPSLSPEANRILTEEARAAVGADRVLACRPAARETRAQDAELVHPPEDAPAQYPLGAHASLGARSEQSLVRSRQLHGSVCSACRSPRPHDQYPT